MLRTRILVGSLFLALLLGVVWLDLTVDRPYPGWLLLCTVCAVFACHELVGLLDRVQLTPFRRVLWPGVLALVWLHWLPVVVEHSQRLSPLADRWPLQVR